ncbi:MAG: inorganic phosphate transporter [Magnetococcales bacterium]|nr:inorganic phosphate transporter [Magnetococcales bacterium]
MELGVLVYLSSGLFLGWSLGANDAANVFGTAVGTRMIKFSTAAIICAIFITLGAVISGAGAAHTLSKLGDINALGGAFVAAFSAAAVVAWLTILGLPVSTTQAIVGAIIGWNFFTGMATDFTIFNTIIGTWFLSPVLTAIFSYFMYKAVMWMLNRMQLHIVRLDAMTRLALLIAGVLGSYSLGANNIANVMGVFIGANPFQDFAIGGLVITGLQQLFFVGSIAIAVGVATYSKKVMMTVGDSIVPLTPVGAFVVIIATSLVLFLFASSDLEYFLASLGLPTIPLVPVSSSQAVVGGVIGIGMIKNRRNIKWGVTGRILVAWVQTPVVSALFSFMMLFIMQNLFGQTVFEKVEFQLSQPILVRHANNLNVKPLEALIGKSYSTSGSLKKDVDKLVPDAEYKKVLSFVQEARMERITVDPVKFPELDKSIDLLTKEQIDSVKSLAGKTFDYRWQLVDALTVGSESWRMKERTVLNKKYNKQVQHRLDVVLDLYTEKMK